MSERLGPRLDRDVPVVATTELLDRVARLERRRGGGSAWQDFSPAWWPANQPAPTGWGANTELTARFMLVGRACHLYISAKFGSINGGQGEISVGLPIVPRSPGGEQLLMAKLWTGYRDWPGYALLQPGHAYIRSLFPVAANNVALAGLSNVPAVPELDPAGVGTNRYPVRATGALMISGTYEVN